MDIKAFTHYLPMTLRAYCNDSLTDKDTVHSYVDVYEALFSSKRDSATHVLEIGIGPYPPNGGSILMWAQYFKNAEIHAADIISMDQVNSDLVHHPRIHLHCSTNAYHERFVENRFLNKEVRFDILVDDGPHTLESMVSFLTLYSPLLKSDGILVIEDVQEISWMEILRAATPAPLKPYVHVVDLRSMKGRYDDMMFVIDLSKSV
jgi:cephalosporin hydroxylase